MEWEQQADACGQAVTTTLLEQRALLDDWAEVEAGELGRCPHCQSDRLYLRQNATPREMQTSHGLWCWAIRACIAGPAPQGRLVVAWSRGRYRRVRAGVRLGRRSSLSPRRRRY